METPRKTGFHDRLGWYVGISSYWFATSLKWFVLLQVVLPGQVEAVVPGGEKNTYWGAVFAIGAIWATVGPAIFGSWSDRVGRRRLFLSIGATATLVPLAFLAQANSLWMLMIGYLLLQITDDVSTGPYSALVPQVIPEERRGFASGVLGVFKLLSQVVGAVALLALSGNVLMVYSVIALFNIVCAAISLYATRDLPDDAPPRASDSSSGMAGMAKWQFRWQRFWKDWARPWGSYDFRLVWFSAFLGSLALYLVQPYIRFYLQDVIRDFSFFGLFTLGNSFTGTPEEQTSATVKAVSVLILLISLFGAIGAAIAARLTDRLGRKRVILLSGFSMGLTLIPFALIHNFGLILILTILFGLGLGGRTSADWAMASDVLPNKDELGKDMGLWQMSQSSVQVFAGSAGILITMGNRATGGGGGYMGAILVASVLFVISTMVVQKVKGSR
jgi:MFS family permease